jgi:PBSX family phage terminase large subunit
MDQTTTVSKINEKFLALYTSPKRYFILTGGRGSGKTYTVHEFIARLTYEVGHGILFTRYTMVSAERSVIPEFKQTLERLGIVEDFHITKTHIYNKRTNSFIYFTGIKTSSGDQTANLKSLPGITTWVIEEGEDYKDKKSFMDIDDSIRKKGIQNRVIWIQNPDVADESFIYQDYYKGYEKTNTLTFKGIEFEYTTTTHPDVENIHTTYLDNRENLNQDKLSKWDKVAETDRELFQHKYIGGWLKDKEGAVFKRGDMRYFTMDQINLQNVEAVVSFIDPADRGTDNLSMPIGLLIGDLVYIVDWYFSKDNQDITIPEISYWAKKYSIEHISIETNGIGLAYYEAVQNIVGALMYPFNSSGNKHSRIISNSGFIRNYFFFRSDYEQDSHYAKAMIEFFAYNKDKKLNSKGDLNDDAPDSVTGLWLTVNDLWHGRWL